MDRLIRLGFLLATMCALGAQASTNKASAPAAAPKPRAVSSKEAPQAPPVQETVQSAETSEPNQKTIAEGNACMGDDKSRKQTEEAARKEATRRASEQVLSLVRSTTMIKDMALEQDLIAAYTQAQVRVLEEIERRWDKDCYHYKIRAAVTPEPVKMGRFHAALGAGSQKAEDNVAWNETQEARRLALVDDFIARYPLSAHLEEAKGLRDTLVAEYPRTPGQYIAITTTSLHFKPRDKSAKVATLASGDVVTVAEAADNDWAEVKRDYGMAYGRFADLRPVGKEELAVWQRCRDAKDIQQLESFIAAYPLSSLGPKARELIVSIHARQTTEASISQADREEIAFWNLVTRSRDLRDVREYRRRWPHGKFDRESLSLLIELTTKSK